MTDPSYRALAQAALDVGLQRARMLDEIRKALIQGDNDSALALMRVYTGIEEDKNADKESDRTGSGLH